MNAIKLLESQHAEVKKLFKQIEKAKDRRTSNPLFDQLAAKLVAHDAIERDIFYPACKKKMGMTDLLGEALVEHGLIEFSLHQADVAKSGDGFDYKVVVLREVVEHHLQEEEKEFFPKAAKALGEELLEQLGTKMEAQYEAALKADYRGQLRSNLRQVLAGVVETTKSSRPRNGAAQPARARTNA